MSDVFGRERHKSDREDMGGVGSFNRQNKTLYVGGIRTSTPDAEAKIRAHFGQFGPIEKINIIHGRSIVFVTYNWRVSAEFAKEAVADQSVVTNEIVNVRWAHEDPNPRAIAETEERVLNQALTAIHESNPEYFSQYEALHGEGVYPQTDHQYAGYLQAANQAATQPLYPSAVENTEWVQVGDEVNGYFWVSANSESKPDSDAKPETDAKSEDVLPQPLPQAGIPSEDSLEKKPAVAAASASVTASDSSTPAPSIAPVSAEEQAARSYYVWQSFYASNGYPYYQDNNGQVVYYDPSHYDAATLAQLQARSSPPAAQPVDAFQYYSQVPVNRTDTSYFSHFQSYSDGTK
jgi:hypothetical protein